MTSELSSAKVCVITDATVNRCDGRNLYIVDLVCPDVDESGCLNPTAKLYGKTLTFGALCVVGSMLYVFADEGESEDGFGGFRKQVYSYNLSSSTSDEPLTDRKLTKVCEMNDTKFSPCATASPDGKKIVVHSSTIMPFYDGEEGCDFELFDVNGGEERRGKCKKLPELRPWDDDSWGGGKYISIISSAFKGGSVVLVLLRTRIYSLDLNQLDKWKVFAKVPWGTPFDIIGEDIYLTSSKAYYDVAVAGARARSFSYPDLSTSEARGPRYPIVLHRDDDDEAVKYFCILHAGSKEEDEYYSTPDYIIDVYRCDVEESKTTILSQQQEDTLPATTKFKPLHFSLKKDYTYLLRKCRFTSIPPQK